MHKYVDIWEPSVASEIMAAVQQVFGDTDFEDNYSEEEDADFLSFFSWGKEQDEELIFQMHFSLWLIQILKVTFKMLFS